MEHISGQISQHDNCLTLELTLEGNRYLIDKRIRVHGKVAVEFSCTILYDVITVRVRTFDHTAHTDSGGDVAVELPTVQVQVIFRRLSVLTLENDVRSQRSEF